MVLDPLSYDELALSTGVEPAPPGRQPSRATRRVRERVPATDSRAVAGHAAVAARRGMPSRILAIENRGSGSRSAGKVEPRGIEPRSGGCKPPSWPPRAPSRATAGIRTRSAALATPCASDLTPRSHRERPERGSNPRHRCERPASWPTRRPGRVEHGRKESNPLRRRWRPHGHHVLVRKIELLGRDSNHASFGSEPKILPLDDRGTSCDGWGRTSVVRVTAGRPAIERRRIDGGERTARGDEDRGRPRWAGAIAHARSSAQ